MKMVTRKAPKQIHYSAVEGLYYRVTTAVSKKNKVYGYSKWVYSTGTDFPTLYLYVYNCF